MKIAELRPHSDSQRPQARASSALLPSCGLAAAWKAKAAYYAITGSTRRRPGDDQSASSIEDQVHLVDAAPGVVPAATLSCLQAVCDAAAGRPFAVPGQVHEDQESEAHDAPALERAKRASLMIKASVGHTGAMRAMCSLEHCKLTLSNDQRLPQDESVVVEVQLKELGVGLRQGLANMFTVVTVRDNKMASDDICCFANNQTERDEWVSAFRSMGVPVFDVSEGTENAKELSPEAVISFQVCQYLSRLVTRIQRIPSSGGSAGTINQAHTGHKQVRFGTDGHGERRGI